MIATDCFLGPKAVSGDGKSKMLMKDDFAPCKFYDQWDQCLDGNGDGVRIKFPVKVYSLFYHVLQRCQLLVIVG